MSGIPPIKPGKVEKGVDVSASAAASAAPRLGESAGVNLPHQDLAGRDTFALSSFIDGLIQDYVGKNPDQADQIRAINAPVSKTVDSDGKTEFSYTLPTDVRKLMALQLIPSEFKAQYVMDNIRDDNQLIALRAVGLDFENEMAAVQDLYNNCSTTCDIGCLPHDTIFPEGCTKEGIWHDLFGPVEEEAAIVAIYERFGCLPSEIPEHRRTFMGDNFIAVCQHIDEMIEKSEKAEYPSSLTCDTMELNIFPPKIAQIQNLEELTFIGEKMTALPPEIGLLEQLRTFRVQYTPLSSLPPELAQLKQLKILDLSYTPLDVLPELDESVATLAGDFFSLDNLSYIPLLTAKLQIIAAEEAANIAARDAKVRAFLPAGCQVIFANNY